MIIYYDSGGRLFTDIISENGQKCVQQYRSIIPGTNGMIMFRFKLMRKLFCRFPVVDVTESNIIVFDTWIDYYYIKALKKKYPDKRIHYWLWNQIDEKSIEDVERIKTLVPVWSYSPADCEKYGLKYNTQFFFDNLIPENKEELTRKKRSDEGLKALFIGREKKRRSDILQHIISELEKNGVEVSSYISKSDRVGFRKYILNEKLIPYKEVLKKTEKTDILIDCYGREDAGCSLRVMESLFFEKKLVTNNLSLAYYDFYDSHNIYIMGKEERSLKEFLSEPYVPVSRDIRDRYRFSSWVERFLEEK